ncbi:LysR substrate-binding domain-containing protein, partial [Streptomyces sp. URMC 126]|uniref:LysR substrate-binding domain-containing protein n=1 Tax=Streptomyces sp. URMC 126 TaxID=3423401 RepID=UPI003F1D4025
MFDLHRLRLLRELKHRGTLAAVAAALSYSPSTVSQQLSQLEAEAGVRLLEPVGRRVRLTHQADILVAHTEVILERLERAQADIADSLADTAGTLRLAAFQTAALTLVPPALSLLRAAHPRLRVHVTQGEPETALPALLARDFDLVVTEEYPGDPIPHPAELEREALLDDTLRLAVPGPADGGPPTALRMLADHPWVMEPEGTAARRWATALCREAGFEPDVRFESSDLLLHLRLVEEGHAAAFLPDLVRNARRPTVPL